ncbi:DUF192 domain-containing protein [Pseudidiomarina aestuarii]|uniref:DUF192 domain-containing protein n=1 Tax=Pseudidiomarina aestuarii TaxID=624146 RepID=A0A2T4CU90_9GAMM|nr:DUF192 domain-containing protein [Pseudidiomarina aestuarii]PTB89879.1 DUF192 domain-containing protein [Pseudidiomarina aestuarii]
MRHSYHLSVLKTCAIGSLLVYSSVGMPQTSLNTNLETTKLCIAGHEPTLTVEIADTFESRARGLMARESLAEHAGMWFVYETERPGNAGFWMFNTYIPLDIAYLDEQGKILTIIPMEPCPSIDAQRCPAYDPGVSYFSALEMNMGYFDKYDIQVGATIQECNEGE